MIVDETPRPRFGWCNTGQHRPKPPTTRGCPGTFTSSQTRTSEVCGCPCHTKETKP